MKIIFRQIIITLSIVILLYGIFYAVTIRTYPEETTLDANLPVGIFSGSVDRIVMNRKFFRNDSKKIIFVGSSNVREGFRPNEFAAPFPDYEIFNLGTGASNITQLLQIVKLVYEVLPEHLPEPPTFVLGIFYGSFVDDTARWKGGNTSIEDEQLRYFLYKKVNGQIVPQIPQDAFPVYVNLLKPFLAFSNLLGSVEGKVKLFFENMARRSMRRGGDGGMGNVDANDIVVNEEIKTRGHKYWNEYMGRPDGTLSQEQFDRLIELVEYLQAKGARLLVVDLPLPRWHTQEQPLYADYLQRREPYLKKMMAYPNIAYLDMTDLNQEQDFYDSAHPKPKITHQWAERVARGLKQSVK